MKCLVLSGDWERSSVAGLGFFTLLLLCAGCCSTFVPWVLSVHPGRLKCSVLLCCGPAYPWQTDEEQSWAETILCAVCSFCRHQSWLSEAPDEQRVRGGSFPQGSLKLLCHRSLAELQIAFSLPLFSKSAAVPEVAVDFTRVCWCMGECLLQRGVVSNWRGVDHNVTNDT